MLPFTDKGTAGKVGFIRVPAVPLSFPEKRLFTAICGSKACVASGIAVMCCGKHLVRTPFQD